jgi:hypothetical protein
MKRSLYKVILLFAVLALAGTASGAVNWDKFVSNAGLIDRLVRNDFDVESSVLALHAPESQKENGSIASALDQQNESTPSLSASLAYEDITPTLAAPILAGDVSVGNERSLTDFIDKLIMFNLQNMNNQGWLGNGSSGSPAYVDRSRTTVNYNTGIGTGVSDATIGSVLFAGTDGVLAQDNPNLFWDDTNNRLGIGTASPTTKLDVVGSIRLDGGTTGGAIYLNTAQDSYIWSETANSIRLATGSATSGSTGWIFTRNGGSSNKIYFGDTGSTSWIQSGHNLYIKANRGSGADSTVSPDLTIASGLVGIGTSSPSALLSVGSSSQFQVASTGYMTSSITGGGPSVGEFRQNTASTDAYLDIYAGNNGDAGIRLQNPGSAHYWLLRGRGSQGDHFKLGNDLNSDILTARAGVDGGVGIHVDPTSIGAQLHVNSATSSTVGQIIRGASGQTADLLRVQNSTPTSMFVVDASGNVGIGTATPLAPLHVVSPGQTGVLAQRYGGIVAFAGRNSGGTASAPTPSSGFLTSFQGEGYDGTGYSVGGRIYIQAQETWGSTAHGTKMRFLTTPTGSTAVWDRMSISAAGNIEIGPSGGSDIARLAISSNGTNTFSSWTNDGVALRVSSATYTDTSSAGGSTIATRTASSLASPTFASTNAITITNASTLYVASPVAGSNVTITNNKPIDTQTTAYLSSGGTWTNASSRALKENFTTLDPFEVLDKIDSLAIERWNYKSEDASITHIGPVAEEFHAAFDTGGSDGNKAISTIDPAGVALLGVQGLSAKIKNLLDFSWIIEEFTKFGVEISKKLIRIKSLAIGSSDEPSGFVMYDKATKEAYCVEIENGEFIKTPGECVDSSSALAENSSIEPVSEEAEQGEETIIEPAPTITPTPTVVETVH